MNVDPIILRNKTCHGGETAILSLMLIPLSNQNTHNQRFIRRGKSVLRYKSHLWRTEIIWRAVKSPCNITYQLKRWIIYPSLNLADHGLCGVSLLSELFLRHFHPLPSGSNRFPHVVLVVNHANHPPFSLSASSQHQPMQLLKSLLSTSLNTKALIYSNRPFSSSVICKMNLFLWEMGSPNIHNQHFNLIVLFQPFISVLIFRSVFKRRSTIWCCLAIFRVISSTCSIKPLSTIWPFLTFFLTRANPKKNCQ